MPYIDQVPRPSSDDISQSQPVHRSQLPSPAMFCRRMKTCMTHKRVRLLMSQLSLLFGGCSSYSLAGVIGVLTLSLDYISYYTHVCCLCWPSITASLPLSACLPTSGVFPFIEVLRKSALEVANYTPLTYCCRDCLQLFGAHRLVHLILATLS